MKTVKVPEEVDEAVLCAAIQAALRVQTVNFGALKVSAPPSASASASVLAPPVPVPAVVDEEEDSDDDTGDEDEEVEAREGKSITKKPSVASAKTATTRIRKMSGVLQKKPAAACQKRPAPPTELPKAKRQSSYTVLKMVNNWEVKSHVRKNRAAMSKAWLSPIGQQFRTLKEAKENGFIDVEAPNDVCEDLD